MVVMPVIEREGDRLYMLLALFDTRDGSELASLVQSAREGYERSHPNMGEADAWGEFDARWARRSTASLTQALQHVRDAR